MEWIYLFSALSIVLLLSGIFSSRTVVQTNYASKSLINATVCYYLPETIIKINATAKVAVVYNEDNTLADSSRVVEMVFLIATDLMADTNNLLALKYIPNALMSDDIRYIVNSKGLLETVNISSEDRTAEIISRFSEAPNLVLETKTDITRAANTIIKIKEYSIDYLIKASQISNTPLIKSWNLVVLNELGVDEQPKLISADFQVRSTDISISPPTLTSLINRNSSTNSEIDGILTRPIKNISIEIESSVTGNTFNKTSISNVVIIDVTKLVVIPVKRSAFTSVTTKIGIQDGLIISNEINRPSSVEGFVSIPINIVKAIISVPGQLLKFRYDNTIHKDSLEKARLNYEKSKQETEKFYLTKEQEIEKVKLEIEKSNLSNNVQLQQLKFALESSLLAAEKQKIKDQIELNDIKKELEKLSVKS